MPADLLDDARRFLIEEHLLAPDEAKQALAVAATVLADALARLRAAVEAGDAAVLADAAHGLKGNLLNLGLTDTADAAEALVRRGRNGDMGGVSNAVEALGRVLQCLLV